MIAGLLMGVEKYKEIRDLTPRDRRDIFEFAMQRSRDLTQQDLCDIFKHSIDAKQEKRHEELMEEMRETLGVVDGC